MILFLDDNTQRAVLAHNRMSDEDKGKTIWCKTSEEAIITLWDYRHVLERVHLEHDLGGETYVNTKREDCGMEIIRKLEEWHHKKLEEFKNLLSTKFVVHSYNAHAAPIMVDRLKKLGLEAKWVPFGTMK